MGDDSLKNIKREKLRIFKSGKYSARKALIGKNISTLKNVTIDGNKMTKGELVKFNANVSKGTGRDFSEEELRRYLSRLSGKKLKWDDKKKIIEWYKKEATKVEQAEKKKIISLSQAKAEKAKAVAGAREIVKPKDKRSVLNRRSFVSRKNQARDGGVKSSFERLGVTPPSAIKDKPRQKPKLLGSSYKTSGGLSKAGPSSIMGNSPRGLSSGTADNHKSGGIRLAA